MIEKKYLILICFFFCMSISFSQNEKQEQDSTTVYHDIRDFSKKNNFSNFFYKLIFKSSALENKAPKKVLQK